jgi:cytochrome c oxidase subunit 1
MAYDTSKPEQPEWLTRLLHWLGTTNHKEIGLLYLFTGLVFLVVGGAAALGMRAQLAQPDANVVDTAAFNSLFTVHGLTMVFLVGMPLISGFANYVVPLQLGAKDLPFPRINALSFWLVPAGGFLLYSGFLTGRGPDFSWTMYPPYSAGGGAGLARPAADFALLGVLLMATSSLLASINFLVLLLRMRAPGMGLMRTPLFSWSMLSVFFMGLMVFPVFTVGVVMLFLDLNGLTGFFNPGMGGDPVLFQHLFWFWGHPEVYILVVPGFGALCEIIPVFSRRPVYGYRAIVWSLVAITLLSMVVWTHHMYTSNVDLTLLKLQMVTTHLISVPVGVIVLCWLATLWGGRIRLKTPMLFALGSAAVFIIGGITGMFLATIPLDIPLQDTYFVVAHFHFTLIGGTVLGLLAALYYWWPKMTGRMLSERLGQLHFLVTAAGFFVTFWPQHYLGMSGMPRRIATYSADTGWGPLNMLSTVGAFVMGAAQLFLIVNLWRSWKRGPPAGSDPWGAPGLEWTVPSPPPPHNFDVPPVLK